MNAWLRGHSASEVEMDRKSWERRNSDMAVFENQSQLESRQMELIGKPMGQSSSHGNSKNI